jgi:hypothetical protein
MNKIRMKRILVLATFVATFGCSYSISQAADGIVTLTGNVSGYTENGVGYIKRNDTVYATTYTWQAGNDDSSNIIFNGNSLTINGFSSSLTNGIIHAISGDLKIETGTLTIDSDSSIADAVNTEISSDATLYITGGKVSLNEALYDGTISIYRGTLNINNTDKHKTAIFTQNGGETTITGDGFELNNNEDLISGGTLNIGDGTTSSSLAVKAGSIEKDTIVNITPQGTLNISDGAVSLDNEDTWSGDVSISGGTINIDNTTKWGAINQIGGTVNVTGTKFELNNEYDSLNGGILNIGDGNSVSKLNVSNGTITKDSTVNLAEKSSINVSGNGDVTLDYNDNVDGDLSISSGNLALIGITKKGTFTQTGGSTLVTGTKFNLDNENDYIDGGTFTIGNETTQSKVEVSTGGISKNTATVISKNSSLNITGGDVEIDSKSTWDGNINVSNGHLSLDSVTKNKEGIFTQSAGRTNITGTTLDLGNSEDLISGGTLNIGDSTTETKLTVSQGAINSEATVNINKNATIDIAGGSVALDNDDSWYGNINVSNGSLSLNNIDKNSESTFTQTNGKTNVSGNLSLNNENDKISGGNFDIGDGTTSSIVNVSKGSIEQDANITLNEKSTLNISGGNVALDNSDVWNGDINVSDGNLALVGINHKNGILTQTKGTTTITETGLDLDNSSDTITGGTLTIGDGETKSSLNISKGTIGVNTSVNIKDAASLNVSGGEVNLGEATSWNGNVEISSGTLNINSTSKDENGIFTQSEGTTTITGSGFDFNNTSDSVSGGTLNVGNGSTVTTVDISKGTIQSEAITNINSNATLNVTGGNVKLNEEDTYKGNINVSAGSLALVGISKNADGVLTQSGGTTTINDTTFDLNNADDKISAGILNIGTDSENSTLTVSKGEISEDAETNLSVGSNLEITGGNVTLNNNDNLNGNINVSNGNLNLNGINKNSSSIITQTGGTTTVTNSNTLNNENDNFSEGNLIIGTADDTGKLITETGTIESKTAVTINETGTLNIKGGTTTLDGANDKWNGEVKISDGTLNLNNSLNQTTTSTTKFNQTGGEVNIDNAKLTLNTSDSSITGGVVNLTSNAELTINNSSENSSELNSTNSNLTIKKDSSYKTTNGTIDEDSKVIIEEGGTLELEGENVKVTLDGNNDNFAGHAKLSKGTLNLTNKIAKNTTTEGTYKQTDGTLNITNSTLSLNEKDSIITGGEVNVTEKSTLAINNGETNSSRLNISDSEFSVKGNSSYTTTGGTISESADVTIESGSKLKINGTDANVTLNGNQDNIDGHIELNKGTLYISDDLTKVTNEDGTYVQTGGALTMSNSSMTIAENNSKISGGEINLTNNSNLTINKGSNPEISKGDFSIDDTSVLNYLSAKGLIQYDDNNSQININTSGLINMINNVRTENVINNLTINNGNYGDGQADFTIDIRARSNNDNSADTITANSIKVATANTKGTIHISDFNIGDDILGYDAPIDRHIRLGKIFKTDNLDNNVEFSATDKEIFTPIGYYKLNASSANDGSYTFDLTRYNPQVFRGQVATVSSYMNQLAINDTIFNRAQIRRYGSSYSEAFKNKTAILDGSTSYERTLKDGQLWTEVYGNFESMKLNRGIGKVNNNAWGFIVGGDFGLKELKNGWKLMPSAYVAYNGGHQSYKGVGITENGGQIGFSGSFMKNNFIETGILYGGLFGTDMDVAGNSEDAFNYFVGLASKTAYDINMGSHFKLQPALTLAYNMFGKQNWHSNYGQMGMSSGFLNGFNVAPGVNFVLEQETWSLYATIAYAWNFFGGIDGSAGNVDLPSIRLSHGYLQYGFGFNKTFSDRLNMYIQATLRNIGRTGVLCQGGLNWRL